MLIFLDQDNSSSQTSTTTVVLSVIVGLPAALILIAFCTALATGSSRSRWFFCNNGNTKILNSNLSGKRQTGINQRRTGGKFLDSSSSTRNLNGGRGFNRGGNDLNSSNVQQQISSDLQIR